MSTATAEEVKSEEPPIWRHLQQVQPSQLEHELNELTANGYQVYRIDRINLHTNGLVALGIHDYARASNLPEYVFDVVAFDPVRLGEKTTQRMNEMMLRAAAMAQGHVAK